MKNPSRWLIRIALLLVFGVIAATFFRYEYTQDKSVRVDRITGKQEVFCAPTQAWATVQACYGTAGGQRTSP